MQPVGVKNRQEAFLPGLRAVRCNADSRPQACFPFSPGNRRCRAFQCGGADDRPAGFAVVIDPVRHHAHGPTAFIAGQAEGVEHEFAPGRQRAVRVRGRATTSNGNNRNCYDREQADGFVNSLTGGTIGAAKRARALDPSRFHADDDSQPRSLSALSSFHLRCSSAQCLECDPRPAACLGWTKGSSFNGRPSISTSWSTPYDDGSLPYSLRDRCVPKAAPNHRSGKSPRVTTISAFDSRNSEAISARLASSAKGFGKVGRPRRVVPSVQPPARSAPLSPAPDRRSCNCGELGRRATRRYGLSAKVRESRHRETYRTGR